MKRLLFILFLLLLTAGVMAQSDSAKPAPVIKSPVSIPLIKKKPVIRKPVADTATKRDTIKLKDSIASLTYTSKTDTAAVVKKDSIQIVAKQASAKKPVDTFYLKLLNNPYFKTTGKPLYFIVSERQRDSKDEIFYLLSGLLLCLAFVRLVFSRYFVNIFRLFFQPTFRQKQTREQLLQGRFPSMLLNFFFVLSCGTYVTFLLVHYNLTTQSFSWLLLYSCIILLVVYAGKYILLSLAGWVFDVKEATETYLFAVYLINKILGVLLVPFIMIVAFAKPEITAIGIAASGVVVVALFIYRYIVSFVPVQREVKVSPFHFVFYICAFEIIPLLLIYKTLALYLNKSL